MDKFIRRIEVSGLSMLPTLSPGERVTGFKPWRRIRPGDIVVFLDPRDSARWMIKRCVARHGSALEVRGDNPDASTDSRDFGAIDAAAVRYIARVS